MIGGKNTISNYFGRKFHWIFNLKMAETPAKWALTS